MANDDHLRELKTGVRAWNEWVRNHGPADLSGAVLSGARLRSEDAWTHLDLDLAYLSGVDLSKADLGGATFINSDLTNANLRDANLSGADFWGACLDGADLSGALLYDTDFTEASLERANFSASVMLGTRFGGVDLSQTMGLDLVRHEGPCRIDLDVIYLSNASIPESFLRGAGVPDSLITYMGSLMAAPIEYYSCFISYSSLDQEFADLLHSELRNHGTRVWLATEDLKIGDRFRTKIDEAIKLYDKLLLILSEHSINSSWVEAEVESAFEKEKKSRRPVLFPVRLDDAVMCTEQPWAAAIRRTRHIGDFRKWQDQGEFQNALARLLRDLRASDVGPRGGTRSAAGRSRTAPTLADNAQERLEMEVLTFFRAKQEGRPAVALLPDDFVAQELGWSIDDVRLILKRLVEKGWLTPLGGSYMLAHR